MENQKLMMRYKPRTEVERIPKLVEDMLMIRIMRMEPASSSQRVLF